jgi:hypothetical protein
MHRANGARAAILAALLSGGLGLTVLSAPAGAAVTGTADICNNQHGNGNDCQGGDVHGSVSWTYQGNGDLVLEVTPESGFGGWGGVKFCAPYAGPTQPADCTGASATVLHPDSGDYAVTGVTGATVEDKAVSFDCDGTFTVTVAADALPAGEFAWALHLDACAGGTDEAFGVATPPPPDDAFVYQCAAPTEITTTGAVLHATTDDPSVTAASFDIDGQTLPGVDDGGGAWSAAVTGLDPNTAYTYSVTFTLDHGEVVSQLTVEDCALGTDPVVHSYSCSAATGVTDSAATLNGETDDPNVDGATAVLNDTDVPLADGGNGLWSGDVTGLDPVTSYTYDVSFTDGGEELGTAEGCAFSTGEAPTTTSSTTATTTGSSVLGSSTTQTTRGATQVLGTQTSRQLPRTGSTSGSLLVLSLLVMIPGVGLVLAAKRVHHGTRIEWF